jgi:hypothetical protein
MQPTSFRPPASRGRGGRSFSGGRFGNQPRNCTVFFVARTRAHNKDMPGHNSEAEGNCWSWGAAESAEASPPHRFMLFSIHPRIRRQSITYDFYCFGKPFSSFVASVATTTTVGPQSAAIRVQPYLATTRPSGGVQSSHSQQHCAWIEAYLLKGLQWLGQGIWLIWCILTLSAFFISLKEKQYMRDKFSTWYNNIVVTPSSVIELSSKATKLFLRERKVSSEATKSFLREHSVEFRSS